MGTVREAFSSFGWCCLLCGSNNTTNAMNAFVGSKERVSTYSFIGKALLLASVCKAHGRTCRPQGGSSKTRPPVQNRYKTMPLRKRTRWWQGICNKCPGTVEWWKIHVPKPRNLWITVKFSIFEREKHLFNVHAIIQNGRHVCCVVLCGRKIKANAEWCVIREKSVLIPVNGEFSILISVNGARHSPFPTFYIAALKV